MGGFGITEADCLPLQSGSLILIGPDEPKFWPHFMQSPEYCDGISDPLDRWSKRTIDAIAEELGGHALFPFGDPPFHPFYTWALRSGSAWASPIAFLVHESAGLFASYRGALVVPEVVTFTPPSAMPCDTCLDQPCTTGCPVDAFSSGYDVIACKDHLNTPTGSDSMRNGCAARRACPIGQGKRVSAQAAFHMKAFNPQ